VYLSEANSNGTCTSRGVLYLSATTLLKVGGFKEQPCVIWEVIVSIHVIIVQGETVGFQSYRHQGKKNEVDYLLTHLAPWITVSFRYAAKTPSIRGPFKEDVMPNELLTCRVEDCILELGSVLAEFLPRFPCQIWASDVTFVTFFGDKKCDALHLSHFWEECDALAHENIIFNL